VKPSEQSRHLFVYGTLVDPAQLDAVLGHKHLGERLAARLPGYRRVTTETYAYPFVVEDASAWVDGVLVMDLSPYDMQVLDRYEDVDSGVYRRDPVQVEAWDCGPRAMRIAAEVYVAGASLEAAASTAH
jgi:gamma-glutamylcyclotransferase (GGCT)/AIG2-like uncharacterized protein YtfP